MSEQTSATLDPSESAPQAEPEQQPESAPQAEPEQQPESAPQAEPVQQIPCQQDMYRITFKMAWPAMLESFLINLTGFVDTIMISVLGTTCIAAIGLTDQPRFVGLCTFFAIATSISAIIARRKGEGDRESANRVLRMMLIIGTLLCILISSLLYFGADFIIDLAGSQSDTHELAVGYYKIIMAGLIFTTTTQIINAAQRGVGNTRISMITNTSANIVNVICNYLLITGKFGFPALGVNGAALATVIGAAVGCCISIASALNPNGFIYLGYTKKRVATKRDIRSICDIGSSALVEQVCLRTGFFLFALTVANLGTTALSAHIIGIKFLSLSFSLADGLSIASIALVGRSLGQHNPALARAYGAACQRIGVYCSIGASFIFFFFGRALFSIFTDETVILDYGDTIMKMLCLITFLQIAQVITTGCLRGAGDTKFTAFTSFVSVAIVRPLFSWVLCYPCGLGLVGVWLGLTADQLVRFILSGIRFRQGKWLQIKV